MSAPPDYADFARRVRARGLLWDPWCDGAPRLAETPCVLDVRRWHELCRAAEAVAAVHDELAHLVAADPDLLDAFFAPTPAQRAMWLTSAPHWHGIARADVFATATGPMVCELNSDTPSGEAEAVEMSTLAAAARPDCIDPNAHLGQRFTTMLAAWATTVGCTQPGTAGIVYPTEMTEDLSMVALYRRWLEASGWRVVLGSPFNLDRAADGRASLLGVACDVLVRHYKTDWWSERLPVRDDEDPPEDAVALVGPLAHALGALVDGRTAIVNPFGAVLTQNKRALALCHEAIDRFSPGSRAAIRRYLPVTRRLEFAREEIWHERARWVLKSDHGCEGAQVVVGALVEQPEWEDALSHAIAQRWVAQEYFAAQPEPDGEVVNFGVYLIGGRTAGVYGRAHPADRTTDDRARSIPVLCTGARS